MITGGSNIGFSDVISGTLIFSGSICAGMMGENSYFSEKIFSPSVIVTLISGMTGYISLFFTPPIVKDGEGASKFIKISINGAQNYTDAKKLGMSRFFKEDGSNVPVTLLGIEKNYVTRVKETTAKNLKHIHNTEKSFFLLEHF